MEIRPGDFADPRVVELLREHVAGMHASSPPGAAFVLDLSALQHPSITFFTAWHGDDLLGCGALRQMDATTGEIKSMRTSSRHLRRGAGRAMLDYLLAVARSRGYTRVVLETGCGPAFEPAIRMYRHAGFSQTAAFGTYIDNGFSQFFELAL